MHVTYNDGANRRSEKGELLERANRQLEDIVRDSAELVDVEWEVLTDEKNRERYRLTLTNRLHGDHISADFSPSELRRGGHTRFRLLGLWGNLLQSRLDVQIGKLQQLVQELE